MKSNRYQTKGLSKKSRNPGEMVISIFFTRTLAYYGINRQQASESLQIEASFSLSNLPTKIVQKIRKI